MFLSCETVAAQAPYRDDESEDKRYTLPSNCFGQHNEKDVLKTEYAKGPSMREHSQGERGDKRWLHEELRRDAKGTDTGTADALRLKPHPSEFS